MKSFTKSAFQNAELGDFSDLKNIPKGDLHAHSSLSCPFASFNRLSSKKISPPPQFFNSFDEFEKYLSIELFPKLKPGSIWELYRDSIIHMISDGIIYTEMSMDIRMGIYLKWDYIVDRLNKILLEFKDKIKVIYDLGIPKNYCPDSSAKILKEAIKTNFFKGVDFYAFYQGNKVNDFKCCLEIARYYGLKIKLHTGEFENLQQTKEELEFYKPDIVQHGVKCIEDDYLLSLLRKVEIVNVCPTSNIKLSIYKDYESHPIKKLYDKKINISIGTDDYAVFGKSLTDEYYSLYKDNIFSIRELEEIRKSSLKSYKE